MRWVTRKNAAVDRIACPWLIRRFIDRDAEFLYVEPQEVNRIAREKSAVPYDVGVNMDFNTDYGTAKAWTDIAVPAWR